ncbi:MAG: OmpA family protein [Clostridium sp.]
MARKKRGGSSGPKGDEWLATYSDTITLLMTFFVLLYSMATVDNVKLQQLSSAFNEVMLGKQGDSVLQFNMYNGEVPLVGGEAVDTDMIEQGHTSQSAMYDDVKEFVYENSLNDVVQITQDERGIILQLKDSILFETGKADLRANSLEILNKIDELISRLPNSIIVEGHTDNIPISTSKYDSNWDLSAARAITVVRYFTEQKGGNPTRFSAQGYGEYKPLVQNSSDENRAKNRRVNILLVAKNEE